MEISEDVYMHKQFYHVNSVLYTMAILLNAKAIYQGMNVANHVVSLVFIGFLFACETVFFFMRNKKTDTRKYMIIGFQMLRIFFALYYYFVLGHNIGYTMGSLIFVVFCIEVILSMKNMDLFSRVVCYIVLLSPMIAVTIFISMGNVKFEFNLYDRLINCLSLSVIVIVFGTIISHYIAFYEEKLFSQRRLVERANEANEQLTEQQVKIERTNELLGLQKIQLKNANTRINIAHAEMVVQNEVAIAIAESLEQDKLIDEVSKLLFSRLDIDLVAIVLNDHCYASCSRLGDEFDEKLGENIQQSKFDHYIVNNTTYVDNHVREERYADNELKAMGSLMIIPIMSGANRVGIVIVGQIKADYFVDNRTFFETLSGQLIIGITNTSLYAKMKDMAIRDGLTGIYNRRHLTEVLNRLLGEAMQNRNPISLALFDIDKFKLVNDMYGHLMGDEIIKAVAKQLDKVAMEHQGLAGRYGGEEFVLIFPGKDIEAIIDIVKDFQEEIRKLHLKHDQNEVKVRVSGGLACYPQTCKNPSDLLNRADWAMYHSKRNGRDQITVDSDLVKTDIE